MSLGAGRQISAPTFTSLEEVIAFRDLMSVRDPLIDADFPDLASVDLDVVLREQNGIPLTAEIYVPHGTGPFPVLLFLHGGGWCAGSAEHARKAAMRIAKRQYVVVNLNYRLAPENSFPAALEDCIYAGQWIRETISDFAGDADIILVGGSSAGANLAAATVVASIDDLVKGSQSAHLAALPIQFAGVVLLYGIYDFYLLCREQPDAWNGMIELMFSQAYLGPTYLRHYANPLVSPALSNSLASFPRTYISCGAEDVLVHQSLDFASKLARSGVPLTVSVVEGLSHAFAQTPHVLPAAQAELDRLYEWLDHLAANHQPTSPDPSTSSLER